MNAVVYRVFDADGRLIYIGSTGNLEQRLGGHCSASWWYSLLHRVETEAHATLAEARQAERAAIRAEQPAFNQSGMGGGATARKRLTPSDLDAFRAWRVAKPRADVHCAMRWATR